MVALWSVGISGWPRYCGEAIRQRRSATRHCQRHTSGSATLQDTTNHRAPRGRAVTCHNERIRLDTRFTTIESQRGWKSKLLCRPSSRGCCAAAASRHAASHTTFHRQWRPMSLHIRARTAATRARYTSVLSSVIVKNGTVFNLDAHYFPKRAEAPHSVILVLNIQVFTRRVLLPFFRRRAATYTCSCVL